MADVPERQGTPIPAEAPGEFFSSWTPRYETGTRFVTRCRMRDPSFVDKIEAPCNTPVSAYVRDISPNPISLEKKRNAGMQLAETFIRRPVLSSMVSLGIVLVGVIGYTRLPVREFP